jgi:hypothetical protein
MIAASAGVELGRTCARYAENTQGQWKTIRLMKAIIDEGHRNKPTPFTNTAQQ